jgi:transposase
MDSHTHSAFGRLEIVETGRRRRWSDEEKRRIVLESMSGPRQVSATARRHNVARSQILAWRRAMLAEEAALAPRFVPAMIMPDIAVAAMPADVRKSRIEVVLRSGRRIIFDGGADMDGVLKLARGLEALK